MNDAQGRFYFNGWINDEDRDTPDYEYSTPVTCTENKLIALLHQNQSKITQLELDYGILDAEGDKNPNGTYTLGYSTYEISQINAPTIWNELLKIVQPVISKPRP